MYKNSIKKEITQRSYAFKAAYSQLKRDDKSALKELMKDVFGISDSAFRYRMRGVTILKSDEADAVREFLALRGIEKLFDYEFLN